MLFDNPKVGDRVKVLSNRDNRTDDTCVIEDMKLRGEFTLIKAWDQWWYAETGNPVPSGFAGDVAPLPEALTSWRIYPEDK